MASNAKMTENQQTTEDSTMGESATEDGQPAISTREALDPRLVIKEANLR